MDRMVKIEIEKQHYLVPEGLELLRCFQFLNFNIAFENFCWNASCENCKTHVAQAGGAMEELLCCQELAKDGLVIEKLPGGITKPSP